MTSHSDKPAFPQYAPHPDDFAHGMTLRDYFAAHASEKDIAVALSDMKMVERVRELDGGRKEFFYGLPYNARQIARYMAADAMLKARDGH